MQRIRVITLLLIYGLVLATAGAVAQSFAQPAPISAAFVPTIRHGQVVATVCDGSAPIHAEDTGSLSAIRDADGRYIVAYQDRAHGSQAHVAQHVGAGLEEVAAPTLAGIAPAFSPSGDKQGSLALVPSNVPGSKSRLYYTQRTPEDEERNAGPYGIWCKEF